MIKKVFIIIAFIFSVQLIISCIFCNCPDTNTYNVEYQSVNITALNTAGFDVQEVTDTLHKVTFGISIEAQANYTKSSCINIPLLNLGFNSAISCSCDEDTYLYTDPIIQLSIYIIDIETNESMDVTQNFQLAYSNEYFSNLASFFNYEYYWYNSIQLDLAQTNSIPISAIFRIEATLQSGTILYDETQQINFYN